jgi:hypothetical protein
MKFAGWYGIIVGLLLIGQWTLFIAMGQVSELRTEPIRMAFHLAAEFTTAVALIVGGIALMKRLAWGMTVYLVAIGTLICSVIVSPGYFAQRGQWFLVGLFGGLLVLALASIRNVARSRV